MPTSINVDDLDPAAFAGRTAIVTGGSGGIGYITGTLLYNLGCNVVLGDLRHPDKFDEDPIFTSKRMRYQQVNVTSWESVKSLFTQTVTWFGSVDIVCANAGVNEHSVFFSPERTEPQTPDMGAIDVNIKGTFYTVLGAMHYMKGNSQGGSIIMTASMAGYFPQAGLPLYTASKFAIIGFMRVMAQAGLPLGIAVSCVSPGLTETIMLRTMLDENEKTGLSIQERLRALLKQLECSGIPSQSPEVVGKSIAYLAQKRVGAAGHSLYVQGGEVIELEEELRKSMPEWLCQKMSFMDADATTWAESKEAKEDSS